MAGFLPIDRDARPDITDYDRWYYSFGQYRKYTFFPKKDLYVLCVLLLYDLTHFYNVVLALFDTGNMKGNMEIIMFSDGMLTLH